MINGNNSLCSGCSACEKICPTKSILLCEDKKGFYRPIINSETCIKCDLCDKVCQCNNHPTKTKNVPEAYYVMNNNHELLINSQSGGLFSAVASIILNESGVCYGVAYTDELKVIYTRIDNIKNICKLQGSKYVNSNVGDIFSFVENDLKKNIKVLFSGTSCVVFGLLIYLKQKKINTENLFTCDLICYGTPSQQLFMDHLSLIQKKHKKKIQSINLRNKPKFGWHKARETYEFEDGEIIDQNNWLELFYSNLAFRDCCYNCQFLDPEYKIADITMGDCWGVENFDSTIDWNETGCSLAIVRTNKGRKLLCKVDAIVNKIQFQEVIKYNKVLKTVKPYQCDNFWNDYNKKGYEYVLSKYTIYGGLRFKIKRRILKTIGRWE